MSLLTLFTAPKPFVDPHISLIQRNAIRSWLRLGSEVQVMLIGDEPGIAETAAELEVAHLANVKMNASGTPLISSIFDLGRSAGHNPMLAYVNADIILFDDFLNIARQVSENQSHFLIVGQRYDLSVTDSLDFDGLGQERIRELAISKGRLHPRGGSDYFIFPDTCFKHIPDFAIGRAGWDNWMIYKARLENWPVIDATKSITIVHQDHDYRHLPGGQSHYRLPETYENVRLAGGKRTILTLDDADYEIVKNKLSKKRLTFVRLLREIELFPLLKLCSKPLANLSFALFHPVKAYKEFRQWFASR